MKDYYVKLPSTNGDRGNMHKQLIKHKNIYAFRKRPIF